MLIINVNVVFSNEIFQISDGFFITLSFLRDTCGYINYTYTVSPAVCQLLAGIVRTTTAATTTMAMG